MHNEAVALPDYCSPPRKSLVKGEGFVRVEGKPE